MLFQIGHAPQQIGVRAERLNFKAHVEKSLQVRVDIECLFRCDFNFHRNQKRLSGVLDVLKLRLLQSFVQNPFVGSMLIEQNEAIVDLHDDIRIELICDKIHVSPEMLAIIFATKPAEAVLLITDSMRASHLPDGMSSLGGLEVIVKNGEARLVKDGALAGSTLRMNIALKNAAEVSGKPLEEVVAMAGHNQARELGLGERLGRLAPGYAADVVIVNPATFAVDAVFVDGEQRL